MGLMCNIFKTCSMCRKLLLTFLLVLTGLLAEAQWRPQFKEVMPKDTIYSIREDVRFHSKAVDFHFPEYDFYSSTETGFAFTIDPAKPFRSSIKLEIGALGSTDLQDKMIYVYSAVHSENVDSIRWTFHLKDELREKSYKVWHAGYQIPMDDNIAEWAAGVGATTGKHVSFMEISFTLKDTTKLGRIILQDLLLYEAEYVTLTSTHKLYSEIYTFTPSHVKTPYDNRYVSEFVDYASEDWKDFRTQIGNLQLVAEDSSVSEKDAFDVLLFKLLDRYIFYEPKKLRKEEVVAQFRAYTDTLKYDTFPEYADKVGAKIQRTFEDPHFKIASSFPGTKPVLERSPIRLYKIGGKYLVGAVLNPRYHDQVTLGAEVTHIDGIPIDEKINMELATVSLNLKNEAYVRQAILSRILDKPKNDSTQLRIMSDAGARSERIYYNERLTIPANFKPEHCELKKVSPDIFYYRINLWDSPVYSRLVSNWDSLKTASSIIFDIRGNGGGDKYSVIQLYSMFIDQASTLYKYKPYNAAAYDSITVKPNKHFKFPADKKVYVLIDSGTACASEIFIMAMKRLANVTVIGSDNSMGAMASIVKVFFPSGVVVHTNSLYDFPHFENYRQGIEIQGVAPDILVKPTSIADLRPFDDVLLTTAVSHARGSIKQVSNKKQKPKKTKR